MEAKLEEAPAAAAAAEPEEAAVGETAMGLFGVGDDDDFGVQLERAAGAGESFYMLSTRWLADLARLGSPCQQKW